MVKVRTIYEIESHGDRARYIEGKRGTRAEQGLVAIHGFSYTVDPRAQIHYSYRRLFGLGRGQDTIYRFMEGSSAPIPAFGLSRDKEYAAGVVSAFARNKVWTAILRQPMDPIVLLVVLVVIANIVLGGVIYSLVR